MAKKLSRTTSSLGSYSFLPLLALLFLSFSYIILDIERDKSYTVVLFVKLGATLSLILYSICSGQSRTKIESRLIVTSLHI